MLLTADLHALLQNATTVEEEVFDVRFEEVVTLIEQEKFEEASALITNIFNEGTIDIRLVMYLLYSKFITQGISSLQEVFQTIISVVNDSWEMVSPIQYRDKYLHQSLTWFLSTIAKKFKRSEKLFKEKKPDLFWKQSLESLSAQEIDTLLEINHSLSDLLTHKINDTSLNQYVLYFTKWLQGLKAALTEEKAIVKSALSTPTPTQEIPAKQISLQEVLNASESMQHLFRKIQAFESLIEGQNFEKAALVSDDIAQIIKSFDPSLFFPKLFTRYFALSASHMDSLSQEWENKGSLKWEALNRLYQTDLEEFIQW